MIRRKCIENIVWNDFMFWVEINTNTKILCTKHIITQKLYGLSNWKYLFMISRICLDLFSLSSCSNIVDWHVRFPAPSKLRYASFYLKHLKVWAKENDFRDFIHLTHTRNYFMIRMVFTFYSCKDRLTFDKWQLVLKCSLSLNYIRSNRIPYNWS